MASEEVLKELFEVAKASRQFAGMSEDSVWKACLAYKDRSDEDIQEAMKNIRNKDQEVVNKAQEQKERLEQGRKKRIVLHEQEAIDHRRDESDAEHILDELFNS